MGDPASGVLWGDRAEGGPDSRAVCFECPWLGSAEGGLDLREGLLDRVEVGRVGREEPELGPTGLDRIAGTVAGVDREIVGELLEELGGVTNVPRSYALQRFSP